MLRVFKLLILWLLVATVPVQGMAAAIMTNCGPGHHGVSAGQEAAGHLHRHPHSGGAPQSHMEGDARQDHADDHDSPDGRTGLAKAFAHKCSACASCCASAALPAKPLTFDSVNLAESFAPFVSSSVAAFLSEGLERPPRLFLA